MSAPAPLIVNVPLEYVALPRMPTGPISWSSQLRGSGCDVIVKYTGLLQFILGFTQTAKYPEVAPVGIVIVIDVLLQELIDAGRSFTNTVLAPCVVPNPVPDMST